MENRKALYEYICEHVEDGVLPDGFSLPEEPDHTGVSYADGAMDGITIYHTEVEELNEKQCELLAKAVETVCYGDAEDTEEAFKALGKECRAVLGIDEFQRLLMEKGGIVIPDDLYENAVDVVRKSSDKEAVKYGLCVLGILGGLEEETKDVIRTMGLCDEFTIFTVFNMIQWQDGNEEIFRLVQKVRGWGRIHALVHLEPETEEIRKWILFNGTDNDVMADYTALGAWEKSGAEELLKGDLSKEEFSAIGKIISALLNEEAFPGISMIENAEEVLGNFAECSNQFAISIDDYGVLQQIYAWAKSNSMDALAEKVKKSM